MARPKSKAPSLRYHISGNSVVTINGRDFYLGKHDSPESFARYAILVQIYQSNGLSLPEDFNQESLNAHVAALLSPMGQVTASNQSKAPVLVCHVTAAYREHIRTRYANSKVERERLERICNEIDLHDGQLVAADYGPVALQRQRERWVSSGKSRPYCNRLTNSIPRIFKYAVSQELVEETTWRRLKSVEPLREGQTKAPENAPVQPVPIDWVRQTAKHLPPILRAMIRVQIATGMRPSEVCGMRPCDIDRSGEEWMYRPAKHKTASRGKRKAVPILGDAKEAIIEYLNRSADSYCFSPREAVQWYNAQKRMNRKSKVQPSQVNRAKDDPKVQAGDCYTVHSYRRAINRATKAAKVSPWHPYQLRHLAGTVVREALGPEATQALLGHAHIRMSEHYAKISETKAIAAAKHAPTL